MQYNPKINIETMETVVIQARNKSDVKFLMDFARRIGSFAKTIDTEYLEDATLVSLIEKGMKTESVGRAEIMNVLNP
ncbi:hypothetical protein FACS189428_3180 [Clostridia bacterium]|nr:hypothetical protein FACS189428_3180 [Clostridia bacterium]